MYESLLRDIQKLNLTENDIVYVFNPEKELCNWYYDIDGFPCEFVNKLNRITIGSLLEHLKNYQNNI